MGEQDDQDPNDLARPLIRLIHGAIDEHPDPEDGRQEGQAQEYREEKERQNNETDGAK